jgi:parallel beta-helix repeat protein
MRKIWFWDLVLTLLFAPSSWAADCGDTTRPGGARVPCSCSDTATTNTILRKTDPVVSTGPGDVCGGDRLQVIIGVALDCNKLTLRGAGVEAGVKLVWGPLGGFTTVKDCTIRGFGAGIDIDDSSVKPIIESNTIIENVGPGIYFPGGGFITVRKNKVGNNGGSGIVCEDTCSPARRCCMKILANSLFSLLLQFMRRVESYRAFPDASSGSTLPL